MYIDPSERLFAAEKGCKISIRCVFPASTRSSKRDCGCRVVISRRCTLEMGSKDESHACTRVGSGLSEEYKTFNRGISQPGINVYILTDTFIL